MLQSKAKFSVSFWSALFFSLGKMRLHPRGEEELGKGLCNSFWGFPWPTLPCPLPTMRLHPGPAPPSQNRLVEPEGRNKERVGDQDLRCVESNLHLSWLGYLWQLWQMGRSRMWWQSPSLGKPDILALISAVCQLCVTGKFNFSICLNIQKRERAMHAQLDSKVVVQAGFRARPTWSAVVQSVGMRPSFVRWGWLSPNTHLGQISA